MNTEQIERLAALREKASEGPWDASNIYADASAYASADEKTKVGFILYLTEFRPRFLGTPSPAAMRAWAREVAA